MRLPSIKALLLTLAGVWAAAGMGLFLLSRQDRQQSLTMLLPRQTAPTFALADQTGRTHDLRDYTKRSVALAFVPGDTPLVRQTLRSIDAELKRFDRIGVKVYAISPMDTATAKKVHDEEKLRYPILTDTGGKVGWEYGVRPSRPFVSYVLGPEQKVLLPISAVHPQDHGSQLVELSSCFFDNYAASTNKLMDKPVADFTLGQTSLYGDKKQKATVLLFVSARCPCSGGYDARNKKLAELYGPKGVRFVAVNSSVDETAAEIAEHAKKHAFPFPVLKDENHRVADRFDAQVTPEVFVMDAQGVLRYHGRIDDSRDESAVLSHDLRNALDFLIAGQAPKQKETRPFGCSIARQALTP